SALQVCGDPALITSLQRWEHLPTQGVPLIFHSIQGDNERERWEHLPTQGVPLIFHSIQGDNEREANSPSWFNRAECQQVNTYVQLLMKQTRPALLPSQIGIITPYAKMAEKIRTTLRSQGVEVGGNGIMVGTTEIFQGQERRVIIISTVRSDPSLVEFDVRHNLGFLANPKRFNVAVTRAQVLLIVVGDAALLALLIVVGDATLLARDPNWGALISYSISHGAFIGQRPEPNE
ncbi:AAA domain-containing protein, partial [Baffinella frigidus]